MVCQQKITVTMFDEQASPALEIKERLKSPNHDVNYFEE